MRRRFTASCVLALVLVSILLVSDSSRAFSSDSAQPPVDTSTYRSGTIGSLSRFDPARAYDTASSELLQNVYEPLIFFGDKPLAPQATAEITDGYVADITSFVPVLATKVPSVANGGISSDRRNWTFTINTNAVFQPWLDSVGNYEPARNVTVADVIYSFQRQMVYDSPYAPTWMWFEPAFGIKGWSTEEVGGPFSTYDNGTFRNSEDEIAAGNMIQSWVYAGPDPDEVTFHFENVWTESVLRQIFAQTLGGIVNKDWVIEHGGWDGQFTEGWTNNYHWKPTKTRSELDVWKDPAIYGSKGSKYPSNASDTPSMCGTGPYRFTNWDAANKTWQIDRFPEYWRGWAQAGDKAGNYLSTVIVQGVDAWPTRKTMFLGGEFDTVVVPRTSMWDLLNMSDASGHTPLSGVRLYWNIPSLSNDELIFSFDVTQDSPYVPKNGTVPAPKLFSDVHMRRAFAYALNLTKYIEDLVYSTYSENTGPRASWWLRGMKPDYENKTLSPCDFNLAMAEEELKAAGVWEQGFEVKFIYLIGANPTSLLAAGNSIAAVLAGMNTKFNVSVVGVDWPEYREASESGHLPIEEVGWLTDFGDPENLARAYMHSEGRIASGQKYNDTHVDYLVDLGLSQPDGPERNATYQELQYIYWRDVPGFVLWQPLGRRWSREWVGGWYYNPMYPGSYYYDLYKIAVASGPTDSGGRVFDFLIPIVALGTIVATLTAVAIINRRMKKKESAATREEIGRRIQDSFRRRP